MNKQKLLRILLIIAIIVAAYYLLPHFDFPAPQDVPSPAYTQTLTQAEEPQGDTPQISVREDGRYSSPEEVALYLHTYGKLPANFIRKDAAQRLGWDADKGNLWQVTEQMSIGGDSFGNREGLLPDAKGRKWYECDVNYAGGFRGGERLVYSSDGLIYYTDDHYESFIRLY